MNLIPSNRMMEFRLGFHESGKRCRMHTNIDKKSDRDEIAVVDIQLWLNRLSQGERGTYYASSHDEGVLTALALCNASESIVGVIGCERGFYPAMAAFSGASAVDIYDIRPVQVNYPEFNAYQIDLSMTPSIRKYDLIMCISTLEHCGLGRYGDDLNPYGDRRLLAALIRSLKPDGKLIISLPIGQGILCNNLHRVYSQYRLSKLTHGSKLIWHTPITDDMWKSVSTQHQPVLVYEQIPQPVFDPDDFKTGQEFTNPVEVQNLIRRKRQKTPIK